MKSFVTARYGYVLVMMVTILIGIIGLVRALNHHGSESGNLTAAAIAFGAATLASRGR